nr:immunoglobulin light chain junction region [Macaca mulatta]
CSAWESSLSDDVF